MNRETIKQKVSVIVSAMDTTGNEKRDLILDLFDLMQQYEYSNMQYYMEYCQRYGYVAPQDWIEKHKHF